METRIVEIESHMVDFTAGIKTLIEQNETKRQIQADKDKLQANQEKVKATQEKQSNQERMNQIQIAISQMSQILIQKEPKENMNDESSKNSTTSNRTNKSTISDNTTGSKAKRKSEAWLKAKNIKEKKKRISTKKLGDEIKIKKELIKEAVTTQLHNIKGINQVPKTTDLTRSSLNPGAVNAASGAT